MTERRKPLRNKTAYTGEEQRVAKERRAEFDQNNYGRLSTDHFSDIGVFKVNPEIFIEKNGFMEPAWIFDRRDKKYQEFQEHHIAAHIRISPDQNETEIRKFYHDLDNRDLLKGMYVG